MYPDIEWHKQASEELGYETPCLAERPSLAPPYMAVVSAYSMCSGEADFITMAQENPVFPMPTMVRLFQSIKGVLHG